MSKLKLGINEKISNAEYHGDSEYLSSSALKMILKDLKSFHKNYVLGEKENVQKNVFDEGSLVHALILEPEVIEEEFAFYPGFTKRGNAFKDFKEANPGKVYISESQRLRCNKYVDAHNRRKEAVALLQGGIPEHTLCEELLGIKVKVRPDYINVEEGYVIDVKTSGRSVDRDSFVQTCEDFGYPLSAVLYCEIAKKIYGRDFDFYFLAISKPDEHCEVFKVSAETYAKGKEDVYKALAKYKKCLSENNWTEAYQPATLKAIEEDEDYEILEI